MHSLESLARVLKNGLATASDRERRLIQYLVTEELEGRGDRLKAFSIATDVLGRSADFDPQTDSIVRVEMGRLRQALDLYYATHGTNDPVRIKFEKGSYRPKFELVFKGTPVRTPQRRWLLITAVLITHSNRSSKRQSVFQYDRTCRLHRAQYCADGEWKTCGLGFAY
jgi:hypothetical protein